MEAVRRVAWPRRRTEGMEAGMRMVRPGSRAVMRPEVSAMQRPSTHTAIVKLSPEKTRSAEASILRRSTRK